MRISTRWAVMALVALTTGTAVIGGMLGVASAGIATFDVAPGTVAPGEIVTASGEGWMPSEGVVLTVSPPGGQAISALQSSADGNGRFSLALTAPSSTGTWQVCAEGNSIDQQPATECATLVTRSGGPNDPNATSTTMNGDGSTDTSLADTVDTGNSVPQPITPDDSTPSTSLPDGVVAIEGGSTDSSSSGPSGLGLSLGIGLGALGVVAGIGAWKGLIGGRSRPGVGIVVVVGALVAGTVSVTASGADTAKVPKLLAVRVQSSALMIRGVAPSTVSAVCPGGTTVIGGGYTTDWNSADHSDVGYLIDWMEHFTVATKADTTKLMYVDSVGATTGVGGTLLGKYFDIARVDRTAHLSDQLWESGHERWISYDQRTRNGGSASMIPTRPELVDAMADTFYRWGDTGGSYTGVLAFESRPTPLGWSATAQLSTYSLMPSATLSVVAVCAPVAATVSDDGVLGARVSEGYASNYAGCDADEVITAVGWKMATRGALTGTDLVGEQANGRATVAGLSSDSDMVYSLCVKSAGLATKTASAASLTSAGYDGSAAASCPTNWIATGGTFFVRSGRTAAAAVVQPHSILSAAPTGAKTFTVGVRGWLGGVLGDVSGSSAEYTDVWGIHPLTDYATNQVSPIDVTALCVQRTL